MTTEHKPHSELVERVRQATASDIPPAPWTWDSEWDSLKGADGRYVLCTRLDFHGRDEEGDNFTSHLDLLKGEDLIALAPEMATALVSLFEQNQSLEQDWDRLSRKYDELHEQAEACERECAALQNEKARLLEQLEAANVRKQELWERLLDMEGKYLDAANAADSLREAAQAVVDAKSYVSIDGRTVLADEALAERVDALCSALTPKKPSAIPRTLAALRGEVYVPNPAKDSDA